MAEIGVVLASAFAEIFPHLDERQRRLLMGAAARAQGYGGIRVVAQAAGVREATVSLGAAELASGEAPLGRARRPGGGRTRAAEKDPGLVPALLALVEPDERGDPESPLRWTAKSTRDLAGELTAQGHRVGADTVGDLLRGEGFSLQGNAKIVEGAQSPDRDEQFRYINEQVKDHQGSRDPVISVDTKKKELVGQFANAGRQWRPKGEPAAVRTHDFPDPALGKAIPYGIYDLAANTGWVNVGTDHDTAAFAVESVRRWWQGTGQADYPRARRLLVTADAGGSNSYRTRAWKTELAAFALQAGLAVMVCHFPPGTSKWNKIEHRLFAQITTNWRGRPLTSHQVIVNTIAATTTATGLRVHAELDPRPHPTGARPGREPPPPGWAHPALTGLAPAAWDKLITTLALPHQLQHDTELYLRRGGPPTRKPGGGHPPALTLAEQDLATIIQLRFRPPRHVLASLFGVAGGPIIKAQHEIRPLLNQYGCTIPPAPRSITTLASLTAYAQARGLTLTPKQKPAR